MFLSLARCCGCLKMPGNEQKRDKNHARSAIISLTMSLQTMYLTQRGINKIPKCFSSPGDCKELSKKTKRSTCNSNHARTKPWPTRPPTSDNNSPITKRIRTNKTQKCFSNLDDCRGLSKKARRWNSRNQGSSQLPYGSGLHARIECKLTYLTTTNSKTDKIKRTKVHKRGRTRIRKEN